MRNRQAAGNKKKINQALKLGTWNVTTMLPGIADDLQQEKTAVINKKLVAARHICSSGDKPHKLGFIREKLNSQCQ